MIVELSQVFDVTRSLFLRALLYSYTYNNVMAVMVSVGYEHNKEASGRGALPRLLYGSRLECPGDSSGHAT